MSQKDINQRFDRRQALSYLGAQVAVLAICAVFVDLGEAGTTQVLLMVLATAALFFVFSAGFRAIKVLEEQVEALETTNAEQPKQDDSPTETSHGVATSGEWPHDWP